MDLWFLWIVTDYGDQIKEIIINTINTETIAAIVMARASKIAVTIGIPI